MIRACVPTYRAVEGGSSVGGGKTHHVYTVHITFEGKLHRVHKRYSAFHELHQLFRKQYIIECPFPPKRLRNSSSKVLESRRVGLELWLQEVLSIHPTPVQLLEFLQITQVKKPPLANSIGSVTPEEQHQARYRPSHQAVLRFSCDPFLPGSASPSPVEAGVLAAIYDTALKLPP